MYIVLTITVFLIGAVTVGNGCLITFFKKYELVPLYEEKSLTSKYAESYSKAMGIIEICGGMIAIILSALIPLVSFLWACLIVPFALIIILLPFYINYIHFKIKN